jgi:hypothetical protein
MAGGYGGDGKEARLAAIVVRAQRVIDAKAVTTKRTVASASVPDVVWLSPGVIVITIVPRKTR